MESATPTKEKGLCLVCLKKFPKEDTLLRHVRRVHLKEKRFQCKKCPYASFDRQSLKYHESIHTGEKPYKCLHCPHQYASYSGLYLHSKRHHATLPSQPIKAHRQNCFLCQFTCVSEEELKEHIRCHGGNGAFKCKLCSFRSHYKEPLQRHVKSSHATQDGWEDSTKDLEVVGFECELCLYRSLTLKEASNHALTAHKPTQSGSESPKEDSAFVGGASKVWKKIRYSCDICPFSSRKWKKLLDHHRVHTGEKPYRCLHCPFLARTKTLLKIHARKTHRGEWKKTDKIDPLKRGATQPEGILATTGTTGKASNDITVPSLEGIASG